MRKSRVERWRGGQGLRFHLPLIEPDVRISRIRLSDKDRLIKIIHAFAHGKLRVRFQSRTRPRVSAR